MTRWPLATILLVLVNVGMACAIGWRVYSGSQVVELTSAAGVAEPFEPVAATQPPVTRLDELTELAVFHKSRSFYVAPPPQLTIQPPPDYRLAGAVIFPGQPASAVLIHAQTGARTRVKPGDEVDGWKVTAVKPTAVTLQFQDRTTEITRSAGSQSFGITTVPLAPAAATAPAAKANNVRILGSAASSPGSLATAPRIDRATDTPRLYQPPSQ